VPRTFRVKKPVLVKGKKYNSNEGDGFVGEMGKDRGALRAVSASSRKGFGLKKKERLGKKRRGGGGKSAGESTIKRVNNRISYKTSLLLDMRGFDCYGGLFLQPKQRKS